MADVAAEAIPDGQNPSASAAEPATLARLNPLEGRRKDGERVRIEPAPPARRASLRAPEVSLEALAKTLRVKLPVRPKTSASAKRGGRAALWLGPDEWLVLDMGDGDPAADCAKANVLCSAVDISHRNVAILVTGEGAAAAINAGCPQDLSLPAFPVGACSRTVLGKIEIVLWRTAEDEFRVECWRSFADYCFAFLAEAARDAAA